MILERDLKKRPNHDLLRVALGQLPYIDRVIVALRYWDNCSINEISEFLDVPWDETDRRLKRSISMLRLSLSKPRLSQL